MGASKGNVLSFAVDTLGIDSLGALMRSFDNLRTECILLRPCEEGNSAAGLKFPKSITKT